MKDVFPLELPAIPRSLAGLVRALWFGLLIAAVLAQLAGMGFALRNAYHTQPAFTAFGLSSAIEYDGSTTVSPIARESLQQRIPRESSIVAINNHAIPQRAHAEDIANLLRTAPPKLEIRLRDPNGRISDHALTRSTEHSVEALRRNPISLNVRMAVRFGTALLATLALIGSAVLLYRRRPEDPEAVLISFAFLLMASVIDPPILMWMGLGVSAVIDGVTGLWWTLIMIAFAAFPSGRFVPTSLRWTIVAAPPLGLVLALDLQSDLVSIIVGVIPPIAILIAQTHRFRTIPPGIERQQIKWAAFGFFAGFVALGVSLVLAALADHQDWSPFARSVFNLAVVCLFSLAFALMPLGLLVSLLRFRLWEADSVIRRSASYAAITIVVGFVFTLAADLTKVVIVAVFGSAHSMVSATLGAVIAVAVFTPARSFVLRWSRERFDRPLSRLQDLPKQLSIWRRSEDAVEIGVKALAIVVDGSHADYAALFALTPTGRELIASSNIFDTKALESLRAGGGGPLRWQEVHSLHDDEGPVGTLMLGPRSDHNRFNRAQRDAIDGVLMPIAEALRIARRRTRSDLLRELEARLMRLEGSGSASSSI